MKHIEGAGGFLLVCAVSSIMQCLLFKRQALCRKPCVYAGLGEQVTDSTEVRKGANSITVHIE